MTSVENQDYLWRIAQLVQVPAVVHGVSLEPLLGPIMLGDWAQRIDWAILGGESKVQDPARPCELGWMRALIEECRTAGVAVFVKQMGSAPRDGLVQIKLRDKRHGGRLEEWPADLKIREWPTPWEGCSPVGRLA
jgi:protein gp37